MNASPGPIVMSVMDPGGPGAYYPSLVAPTGHMVSHSGTLTRTRTLPRPVPPPDVTVMTAGSNKSPIPPSVPPPPVTFARAVSSPHSHAHHPLSTFSSPAYSDIDGHLV